jgi:hypothetical protein
MKKLMIMIGISGALCLIPSCKKNVVNPSPKNGDASATTTQAASPATNTLARQTLTGDTASLYVLIDSKPCGTLQPQYPAVTVDIRGIEVFNRDYGWESLTPVPGAWDVVSIQAAPVPIAEITEVSQVHAGRITKIALTIGDNNHLTVNESEASCYKIAGKRFVIDLDENITKDALNEIVLSIDICGNIQLETTEEGSCYVLKPEFQFQSITLR